MKKTALILTAVMLLLVFCACGTPAQNNANTEPALLPAQAADLEAKGFKCTLKIGEGADYKTVCKQDPAQATTGTLTITECSRYKAGTTLPKEGLAELEGYEWVEIKARTVFDDQNARLYGVDRASTVTTYYEQKYYEQHVKDLEDGSTSFSVVKDGKEWPDCLYIKTVDNQGWNEERQSVCEYTWYARVPEGYDGVVIVFFNAGLKWEDGQYIYEVLDKDALLFRAE
ncbi:MAG: hypothetical protein IKR16_01015 [Firmicutes bacterium]|nr:hypothetical protein [Bacillota bacterium]